MYKIPAFRPYIRRWHAPPDPQITWAKLLLFAVSCTFNSLMAAGRAQIYEKLSKESSHHDLKLHVACCYFMLGQYEQAFHTASEGPFFDFFILSVTHRILLTKTGSTAIVRKRVTRACIQMNVNVIMINASETPRR